ncbi:hypothetical protein SAMN03097708_02507 [Thiohalomonas denitrificans]|uniref:Uncharacterized protein n=1 Tax=Thiohalomonas denitrificans TaxID=415747 RepID=A0A1G5QQM8_9GAMM|nr:hypothetical protein SAMN03097708_02507 [Thiohalomonas denitrificans]
MGFLRGKRALIASEASNQPITWSFANSVHREGAQRTHFTSDHQISPCSFQALGKVGLHMFRGANLPASCDAPWPDSPRKPPVCDLDKCLENAVLI